MAEINVMQNLPCYDLHYTYPLPVLRDSKDQYYLFSVIRADYDNTGSYNFNVMSGIMRNDEHQKLVMSLRSSAPFIPGMPPTSQFFNPNERSAVLGDLAVQGSEVQGAYPNSYLPRELWDWTRGILETMFIQPAIERRGRALIEGESLFLDWADVDMSFHPLPDGYSMSAMPVTMFYANEYE